jgi:hypothetical protein
MLKGCKHNIQTYVAFDVASNGEKMIWQCLFTTKCQFINEFTKKITIITYLAKQEK